LHDLQLSDLEIYEHRNESCVKENKLVFLTLNPLTRKIWWSPNNASRWQMGFNL